MRIMNENNMENVVGGGINIWAVAGITSIITFLVGVFDGFTRPYKCN